MEKYGAIRAKDGFGEKWDLLAEELRQTPPSKCRERGKMEEGIGRHLGRGHSTLKGQRSRVENSMTDCRSRQQDAQDIGVRWKGSENAHSNYSSLNSGSHSVFLRLRHSR